MIIGNDRFFEVYVNCPIDVCADRDPKGIYAKAAAGSIKDFTGISAPYEPPESPSLIIATDRTSALDGAAQILEILRFAKIIS